MLRNASRFASMREEHPMTRYVSAGQLAERYGVDKSTVWRWAKNGTIPPPTKFSDQCTRWSLDDIEQRDAERASRAAGQAA
jgi:prophage regulatory protein